MNFVHFISSLDLAECRTRVWGVVIIIIISIIIVVIVVLYNINDNKSLNGDAHTTKPYFFKENSQIFQCKYSFHKLEILLHY